MADEGPNTSSMVTESESITIEEYTNAGTNLEPLSRESLVETADPNNSDDIVAEPNAGPNVREMMKSTADTEPAYDLALLVGEGALARALEGNAEPYPQLPETDEQRNAFELEFQQALREMGPSAAAPSTADGPSDGDESIGGAGPDGDAAWGSAFDAWPASDSGAASAEKDSCDEGTGAADAPMDTALEAEPDDVAT
ncbi:hypothetical protein PLESTB_000937400 [Pleodorina starrii]|uniref:Uncharacterized protein n=1 Tax=Pleodorina starrii TaxID=330485 RepID=A0A9W6BPD2_9CHLO|nr:hypothetical protein PLESTM_000707400 [Pleodorina starrii]GLC55041.1 hypothetical protein PLESTB_000937400 [Pleodorina starrii]GLC71199.1 hypothetical protein PLESTF_001085000 [Pleodorina starrii]